MTGRPRCAGETPEQMTASRNPLNTPPPEQRAGRDAAGWKVFDKDRTDESSEWERPGVVPGKCCAYNQTCARFLSTNVDAGDFSPATLEAHLMTLTPNSESALWALPFRGIPPTSVSVPIDLIYLDRYCVVIDVVESYPILRASQMSAPPASVLALPAQTIASSRTRPGDKLLVCSPEEMKRALLHLPGAKENPSARLDPAPSQAPTVGTEPSAKKAAGQILQWEDFPQLWSSSESAPAVAGPALADAVIAPDPPVPEPVPEVIPAPPPARPDSQPPQLAAKGKRSWRERLSDLLSEKSSDNRTATRETLPGLSVYFFTGGAPKPHGVRDISATGMYVITNERWYLGTVLRITITDQREPTALRSFTVHAMVVRAGSDGVGLQFLLEDPKARDGARITEEEMMLGVADQALLEDYLARMKNETS